MNAQYKDGFPVYEIETALGPVTMRMDDDVSARFRGTARVNRDDVTFLVDVESREYAPAGKISVRILGSHIKRGASDENEYWPSGQEATDNQRGKVYNAIRDAAEREMTPDRRAEGWAAAIIRNAEREDRKAAELEQEAQRLRTLAANRRQDGTPECWHRLRTATVNAWQKGYNDGPPTDGTSIYDIGRKARNKYEAGHLYPEETTTHGTTNKDRAEKHLSIDADAAYLAGRAAAHDDREKEEN